MFPWFQVYSENITKYLVEDLLISYKFHYNFFVYRSGNDPWDWLAKLMNILESLDDKSIELESEMKDGNFLNFTNHS